VRRAASKAALLLVLATELQENTVISQIFTEVKLVRQIHRDFNAILALRYKSQGLNLPVRFSYP
jgi:hypothetical protein